MSYRQSCDRCRQQKVRCLQEEAPGSGSYGDFSAQGLPSCSRCAKAGVACVYSLRNRTRRSSGRKAGGDLNMSGLSSIPDATALFSGTLGSDIGDLFPVPATEVLSNLDSSDLSNWETSLFSPMALTGGTTLGTGDQDSVTTNTNRSPSPEDDLVSILNYQLTSFNTRTMQAARCLAQPKSKPLTVTSPLVNEAFEATSALIRIMSRVVEISTDATLFAASAGQSSMASGLVFQVLATHKHLLGLFIAICDSVERCLECIDDKQHQQSLHGDGPSSAQSAMVLQLLMHLVTRMDQSLFSTPASLEEGEGQEITTLPASTEAERKAPQCIPVLARAITRNLPEEHARLKRAIQMLLTRIEVSNIL